MSGKLVLIVGLLIVVGMAVAAFAGQAGGKQKAHLVYSERVSYHNMACTEQVYSDGQIYMNDCDTESDGS
jgi:hypothetical protein